MNPTLRLMESLLDRIRGDLSKPHPFAYERVGFLITRKAAGALGEVVLAYDWWSVPDDQYLRDEEVGARINRDAIRCALERSLSSQDGVLHVHAHHHSGRPGPSREDVATIDSLMPSFRGVAPNAAHGELILSLDEGACRLLSKEGLSEANVTVVGVPLLFWRAS